MKPNIYNKNKKCIDCGKLISNNAKRCLPCSKKGKLSPTYKHGKWHNTYCIDCGKKLQNYKAKRCKKCYAKWEIGSNNPNWRGGKTYRYCIYCGRKIKGVYAIMCSLCRSEKIKTSKQTIVNHHIYLKENNNKKSLKLTASKHQKLHNNAYRYLVKIRKIDSYIKWFDKEYGLK